MHCMITNSEIVGYFYGAHGAFLNLMEVCKHLILFNCTIMAINLNFRV